MNWWQIITTSGVQGDKGGPMEIIFFAKTGLNQYVWNTTPSPLYPPSYYKSLIINSNVGKSLSPLKSLFLLFNFSRISYSCIILSYIINVKVCIYLFLKLKINKTTIFLYKNLSFFLLINRIVTGISYFIIRQFELVYYYFYFFLNLYRYLWSKIMH